MIICDYAGLTRLQINLQIGRLGDGNLPPKWDDKFKQRPDILDIENHAVLEIKPDNAVSIAFGRAQVLKYIGTLALRYPGQIFRPGKWNPQENPYPVIGLSGISGVALSVDASDVGFGVIAYEINPSVEALTGLLVGVYESAKALISLPKADTTEAVVGDTVATETALGGVP